MKLVFEDEDGMEVVDLVEEVPKLGCGMKGGDVVRNGRAVNEEIAEVEGDVENEEWEEEGLDPKMAAAGRKGSSPPQPSSPQGPCFYSGCCTGPCRHRW